MQGWQGPVIIFPLYLLSRTRKKID